MLFENFVDAFEEIPIANGLALFQQQVRPLSNESILILHQAVLKRSQVALLDSLDQWLEFIKAILIQYCKEIMARKDVRV